MKKAEESEDVGEKIRALRRGKNVSQEQLAYELGVSRQTIHKWEGNVMQPSTESVAALCKYFGVNPDYFFANNNEADEAAVAADGCAVERKGKDKRFIICLTLLIVFSVLFIVFSILSLWSGFTVFNGNKGIEHTEITQFNSATFMCFVILTVCSLCAAVVSLTFVIKIKGKLKFTETQTKVVSVNSFEQ